MDIIQMTTAEFEDLVAERVSAIIAAGNIKAKASFSTCTHRFGGNRQHDEVEEFITSIVAFKELEGISDENALKAIPLLLTGLASTWWQGIRKEAKTWKDALQLIRDHFSPAKPAYQVYMEFFEKKQEDSVVIDTFVVQKRALLAQLPKGRHNEETELDFIYSLLNIKYRKHIARQTIQTFKDLLEQGRIIELNSVEELSAAKGPVRERRGERCTYCNFRGHTFKDCRKRRQAQPEATETSPPVAE